MKPLFYALFLFHLILPQAISALPKKDFPEAKVGEGDDAIHCGSPDWIPFQKALVSHCAQLSKKDYRKEIVCKKPLLPAFTACSFQEFDTPDSEISLYPLSKKQLREVRKFKYTIYGNGEFWEVIFSFRKNQWRVIRVDIEFFK